MKILLLPNALKGSLSAAQFVRRARCVLSKRHTVRGVALCDGGDGFVDFFRTLYPASRWVSCYAKNAFLKNRRTGFLLLPGGKTAVIETAKICGLARTKKTELNPLEASSYGVGQVLLKAAAAGAKTIYVGLGGVACSDGGAGLALACGAQLTDSQNRPLAPGARALLQLQRVDLSALKKRFKGIKIMGVADVTNPLLGPKSSAKVFGPQKGATPAQVKQLDKAMAAWARALQTHTGRNISRVPGTAAAGAIGAGLAGCFGAPLVLGSQFLIKKINLAPLMKWAELVITAEGKLDRQTFYGKAPLAVLQLAKKYKKPVLFICGQCEENALRRQPLAPASLAVLAHFAASEQEAKKHAARYVSCVLKNI